MAALGRIASLGELYDARDDKFLSLRLVKSNPPDKTVIRDDYFITKIDFIKEESYSEKFDKLNVKAELKLSVLAGLELKGSGEYFSETKKTSNSERMSLIHSTKTRDEVLLIKSRDLLDYLDFDCLNNIEATHVVIGIGWGSNVIFTVEDANTDNLEKKTIKGDLEASLKGVAFSVSANASVDFGDRDVEQKRK